MASDTELLRRYVEESSESAFTELVQLHLNLVYFAALRQVGGDAHRAQEVTQTVFTDLARKAPTLMCRPTLTGWLHTSTRFAAAMLRRSDAVREKLARRIESMQPIVHTPDPDPEWERLRPMIDEAIHGLNERDREAVLLRYFETQPFAEIGAILGLSEDAARMRVERAMDKLRVMLSRRGMTSTSAALGIAFAQQASAACAPVGLGSMVTAAALSGATQAGGSAAVLFMGMTKLQLGVAAALALAGTTGLIVQSKLIASHRQELVAVRAENQAIAALKTENLRLANSAREVDTLRASAEKLARLSTEAKTLKPAVQALRDSGANTNVRTTSRAAAAEVTSDVFELSEVDAAPRVRFQTRPKYPLSLRNQGISGDVLIDFLVDREGNVRKPAAVRSSHAGFESPAVDAIARWKFVPGLKGETPAATHLQVTIAFDAASGAVTETNPGYAIVPRNATRRN